jgi:hypothetical protein
MILRDKFAVKPSGQNRVRFAILPDRRLGALQEPRNRLLASLQTFFPTFEDLPTGEVPLKKYPESG